MAQNSRNLLFAVLLLCNVWLMYWALRRSAGMPTDVPIWTYDSARKYYVVDSEWADAQNSFFDNSAKSLPLSPEEVRAHIWEQVQKSDSALMEKLETELRDKYSGELKDSLQKQINAELRESKSAAVFYNMEKSYKILDDLRASYLQHNGERLRNLILSDFLQNTTDTALRRQVEGLDKLGVDRPRYFHYVIRDLLARHAPYGLGADSGASFFGIGVNTPPKPVLSEEQLTEFRTSVSITDFLDLQDKHGELVAELKAMPRPPKEIYRGDGVVVAARKKDMVGALNVIVQLREEGSELPVEVVLNSKHDYHEHYCQQLLPALNARCVIVEEEIGAEAYEYLLVEDDGFPLKVLALVVSSFDNTIYLDADNFPIKNVDTLFTSSPYLDHKCILWPDMWQRTASPKYYEIAGLTPGEVIRRSGIGNNVAFSKYLSRGKDVAFHDRAGIPSSRSVESGQMVISKSEHFRGLFLALYYNLNGPRYYYPLLYQGSHGVGDRETFVPAFEVMNEPYYVNEWDAVFTGVERQKPHIDETYFDESTMMQSDPAESAKYSRSWRRWLREKGMDSRLSPNEKSKYTKDLRYEFFVNNNKVRQPTALFLHMHDPKINSLANEISDKSRYDYQSRYLKNIGELEHEMGKRDWELRFQAINAWSTCVALTDASYWSSFGLDQASVCQKTRDYVRNLKDTTNDPSAAELQAVSESPGEAGKAVSHITHTSI